MLAKSHRLNDVSYNESGISMEENEQPQFFTLDDTTEDDFILTKLCGKKKKIFIILLKHFA